MMSIILSLTFYDCSQEVIAINFYVIRFTGIMFQYYVKNNVNKKYILFLIFYIFTTLFKNYQINEYFYFILF